MATNADNLLAIKTSLLQSLADETAYQAKHGPRTTYSLEGKSYDWNGWRSAILKQIMDLNALIVAESPGVVISRGRV